MEEMALEVANRAELRGSTASRLRPETIICFSALDRRDAFPASVAEHQPDHPHRDDAGDSSECACSSLSTGSDLDLVSLRRAGGATCIMLKRRKRTVRSDPVLLKKSAFSRHQFLC